MENRKNTEEVSLETAPGVPPCGALQEEFVINSKGTCKPLESFFKKKQKTKKTIFFYIFICFWLLWVFIAL